MRALLLFSVCNYACASTEGAQLTFSDLLSKIYAMSNGDKDIEFDDRFANIEDLTAVNEWVSTSLVRCIAHNDVDLHAKLRETLLLSYQQNLGP